MGKTALIFQQVASLNRIKGAILLGARFQSARNAGNVVVVSVLFVSGYV